MDGMLSQEEINALLNGMDTGDSSAEKQQLTEAEKDAIGEISNISMGTAATTLFSLVNQRVNITTPVVEYATWKDIVNSYDGPCVFIQILQFLFQTRRFPDNLFQARQSLYHLQ